MNIQSYFNFNYKVFSVVSLLFRYGLGAFLVSYLVQKGQFDLALIFKKVSIFDFLVLFLIKTAILYLVSLRWSYVLKELTVPMSLPQAFQLNIQTTLFSYFIPGNVSADLFKGLYATKIHRQPGLVIVGTVMDRIIGLFSLSLVLISAVLVSYSYCSENISRIMSLIQSSVTISGALFYVSAFLSLGAFLTLFYFREKFEKFTKNFLLFKSVSFWCKTIIISIFAHILFAFFLYQCGLVLNLSNITFTSCLVVFPIATLAMVIPLTPGSIGVGQVLYSSLFNIFLGQVTEAATIFTLSQLVDIPFIAIGIFLIIKLKKYK